MSTITKLDPNVRLDRYLRKQMRRDMQKDLGTIQSFVVRGERQLRVEQIISKNPEYSEKTRALLKEMYVRRTVMTMMLEHISKICKDPARSGVTKEAILAKLEGKDAVVTERGAVL